MKNLDYDPGFLLTVAILGPLLLFVEIACRVSDWRKRENNIHT